MSRKIKIDKEKIKWQDKKINNKITKLESLSDEEFLEVYSKELSKGVVGSGIGFLIILICIILMIMVVK